MTYVVFTRVPTTVADTRIMLYRAHAAKQVHQVALVRTFDRGVVKLLSWRFVFSPRWAVPVEGLSWQEGGGGGGRDIPRHILSAKL